MTEAAAELESRGFVRGAEGYAPVDENGHPLERYDNLNCPPGTHDGTVWTPQTGTSHITRLSVDLSRRRPRNYEIEQLYPHVGALPRQDDRYNTVPYRYGFLNCPNPHVEGRGGAGEIAGCELTGAKIGPCRRLIRIAGDRLLAEN